MNSRRLILTWIVGAIVGTLVIAITSPLFVRSYVPLTADPVRGVWTLLPGQDYRWRSEGYATTRIGPLGMPGKATVGVGKPDAIRVAIWGDSQAEGVCVSDPEKLFARVEEYSYGLVEAFPLSRSGEDAADWVTQMPAVERELQLDLHVILLVDLPDLLAATQAPVPAPSDADTEQARNAIAAWLPAFVIQAARHLLTEDDGQSPRRLRFSVGPIHSPQTEASAIDVKPPTHWGPALDKLRDATSQPILIVYVPKLPQIVGGKVVSQDVNDSAFEALAAACQTRGISVIDFRDKLRQMVSHGMWPHGFHNGQIGAGHLNGLGYMWIANDLVMHIGPGRRGK